MTFNEWLDNVYRTRFYIEYTEGISFQVVSERKKWEVLIFFHNDFITKFFDFLLFKYIVYVFTFLFVSGAE